MEGVEAAARLRAAWEEARPDGGRLLATDHLRLEQAVLDGLDPGARFVALSLAGPAADVGDEEADADFWRDFEAHLDAEDTLDIPGMGVDPQTEEIWALLRSASPDRPLQATLAAVAVGLRQLFPLSLGEPGDVLRVPDGRALQVLVMGFGWSARRGHRSASWVMQALLARDTPSHSVLAAALRGFGGGLAHDGAAWIAERASATLDPRGDWWRIARRVLDWALRRGSDATGSLLGVVLGHAAVGDAEDLLERILLEASKAGSTSILDDLVARWTEWPAHVRAALVPLAHAASSPVDAPWLSDTSAEVLLAGLATLPSRPPEWVRERLLGLLAHPDPEVRREATGRLAGPRPVKMVPHTSAGRPRGEVVNLPGTVLGRTALERLHAALADDLPEAAPELIPEIPPEDREAARAALLQGLWSPDVAVRRAAVEGLAQVGHREDAPRLLDAARHFRGLESLVVTTLRALGAVECAGDLARLFHRRLRWADDEAVDDYVALAGADAAPELVKALQTRFYPPARVGAARGIARQGIKEAIFPLRSRALSDPNPDARTAALTALQALSGSAPPSAEIQGYALQFAPIDDLDQAADRCRQAGTAALAGIRTTLSKGSWRRRVAACDVLADIPGEAAEEVLVDALLDPDEDVRLAARKALRARGWEPSSHRERTLSLMAERRFEDLLSIPGAVDVPTLERGLGLGGHVFRSEVVAVLQALEGTGHWAPHPEIAASFEVSRLRPEAALRLPDGLDAVLRAIDWTWQLHPHRAILMTALLQVTPEDLEAALHRTPWEWRAREAVCYALGRPGDDEAARVLGPLVRDSDEDVRLRAVRSLVRIGTPAAAARLMVGTHSPFQEDADAVAGGLAAIGRPALSAIADLASSPWWEERRVAALALLDWRRDRQDAVDRALPLAVDPEYRVAEVAREALRRHGLQPRPEVIRETLRRAGALTLPGLEPWLGLDPHGRLADPQARAVVRETLRGLDDDALVHRVGIVAELDMQEMAGELEAAARGDSTRHVGLRLAAARTLRALRDPACRLCAGRGVVRCEACEGMGEQTCQRCGGRGSLKSPCPEPDCTARQTTRSIGSRACKTCRGRGYVAETCECASGRVTCWLCRGAGRTPCLLCGGEGEAPSRAPEGA
ncbi:MAG: HEAT repeat domain-containing protein [Myxococcota bacterium]